MEERNPARRSGDHPAAGPGGHRLPGHHRPHRDPRPRATGIDGLDRNDVAEADLVAKAEGSGTGNASEWLRGRRPALHHLAATAPAGPHVGSESAVSPLYPAFTTLLVRAPPTTLLLAPLRLASTVRSSPLRNGNESWLGTVMSTG